MTLVDSLTGIETSDVPEPSTLYVGAYGGHGAQADAGGAAATLGAAQHVAQRQLVVRLCIELAQPESMSASAPRPRRSSRARYRRSSATTVRTQQRRAQPAPVPCTASA